MIDDAVLPLGWEQVALPEVCEINPPGPRTPPRDDDLISFVPMAAVEAMSGRLSAAATRLWREVKKGYTRFQEGDVLFAKITPCMENGKIARATGLHGGVGAGSTEFHVLRASGAVQPEYLLHYVLQEDFRKAARARMSGTAGQLRVPQRFLEEQSLPVAPLREQSRIVAAIESYSSRLEDAVATLERVQRNLERYRASLLKAAVEGRLVPTEAELARAEGRDYEPASVLLERILAERRCRWEEAELAKMNATGKVPKDDKWKAKYEEPLEPLTAALAQLPPGWCWATVDQLSHDVRYGSSAKTDSTLVSGVPVLRMGNIVDGTLDYTDLKYLATSHPEFPDLLLEPGDILFNRTNSAELVGKSAVFRGYASQCSFASYLIRVRCLTGIQPIFVVEYINSLAGRAWIASVVSQQVGQANVNGSKLKACTIPLPPAEEQTRIVAESDRLSSLARQLTVALSEGLRRSGHLRQSVLKWAFEGKLVDQDATDEPASALLERILAERVSSTTDKPRRTGRRKTEATA